MEMLVREWAQRTGLRVTDDELPRVAAVVREYLGYVDQVDAAEVDPTVDAPAGVDLQRWLVGHG
jgi:hypothetical protein